MLGARAGSKFPDEAHCHAHDLVGRVERGHSLGLFQGRETFRQPFADRSSSLWPELDSGQQRDSEFVCGKRHVVLSQKL